ncbi:MAG TPA: cytochrome c oxidase subunit 3, partial [Gemmatimonadales bacterium]|nr:cytochrome c oxidase subunit 3 [Gemmatimonadales bacterium]
ARRLTPVWDRPFVSHDSAHAIPIETSTGLESRKLAIWAFIGSECLFFASLISTYLVYKGKSLVGPFPHEAWTSPTGHEFEPILQIPLVTTGTALLLFSSFFVVMALAGAQRGDRRALLGWLGATIFCGVFFVGMQVYEFYHFVHEGLGYTTNLFGSTFYTLTGFHGTHVTIGLIWLVTIWILGLRGKLPPDKSLNLEIAALYWHFVDVVWIVIFPVVYLMR